jgi:hypothetical protein
MSTATWRPDDSEKIGDALHLTRKIRFSLEVMWSEIDFLPDEINATDAVRDALQTISDWLKTVEAGELRDALLTRNYAVIRPVSLACVPSSESLSEITAAIRVLRQHSLLISDD